jgi:hypothetical protein
MDNMQDILKNYYASGGKELFETRENLDEGPVGKALATAALALGLQFGNQVNAEEVFVYQDMQGELQSVKSMWDIPDDVMQSYVVDTDTQKIKYLKKPDTAGTTSKSTNPPVVDQALQKIRSKFKDPESVRFSNLAVYTLQDNSKVLIGMVNAKNSFGGYGNQSPFYVEVSGQLDTPPRDNFKVGNAMTFGPYEISREVGDTVYKKVVFLNAMFSDNMTKNTWGMLKNANLFGKGTGANLGEYNTLTPAKSVSLKNGDKWVSKAIYNTQADTPVNTNNVPSSNIMNVVLSTSGNSGVTLLSDYDKLKKGDIINQVQYKGNKFNIKTVKGFNQFLNTYKGKKIVVYGIKGDTGKSFVSAVKL